MFTIADHFRNMEAFAKEKLATAESNWSKGWFEALAVAYKDALDSLAIYNATLPPSTTSTPNPN